MTVTFSPGDVVSLQSGGAAMTLVQIMGNDADCVWMTKLGQLRRTTLPTKCLRAGTDEYDGVGTLIIEGMTHSRDEIDRLYGDAGNA
ncbi:MAG: DUF2158 domain-containing protein [Sphingobium sp.]